MNHFDFKGATVCITGGTGSFGSTMVRNLIRPEMNVNEIRVFSRDETKQDLLRREIQSEKIKYYIGDVRDIKSVSGAIKGSDFVFHAAALKQVPSCEFFPEQAVATNILGSANVVAASIDFEIKSLVCLSTDKAVYPINAMGISKAMMEKIAQAPARKSKEAITKISITRYGNVMMSRGSVIPLFIDQILSKGQVTITDGTMTRFLMSLQDSIDLVLYAFKNGAPGDLFVRKAPACTIEVLVSALEKLLNVNSLKRSYIGIRHGEKIYESLLSTEELSRSSENAEYFRVPLDDRNLDYKIYFESGMTQNDVQSYTSNNTKQLDVDQVSTLIEQLPEFQHYMKKR
jgi:UDP-glucose 4-epimerase